MPRLWNETVEAHRRDVRAAILDATANLVNERGALSVTMSEIAERTGIGRATLYKYFADIESILIAWHERHIQGHLAELDAIGRRSGSVTERLQSVLERYALIVYERRRTDVAALLHRGEHVVGAQQQLHSFIRALLAEGAQLGDLRSDIPPDELTQFCLHALMAASTMRSKVAVRRLVRLTVDAIGSGGGGSGGGG